MNYFQNLQTFHIWLGSHRCRGLTLKDKNWFSYGLIRREKREKELGIRER